LFMQPSPTEVRKGGGGRGNLSKHDGKRRREGALS